MCEQCVAGCIGYGEVVPGIYFVKATKDGHYMKAGDYGLVICNDPFVVFDIEPVIDPCFEMSDDQLEEFSDYSSADRFQSAAQKMREELAVGIWEGYRVMLGAIKAGYDQDKHGYIEMYLMHKMALMIQAGPSWDGNGNPI